MNFKATFLLLIFISFTFDCWAKDQTIEALDILIQTPEGFSKADNFSGFVQAESFATIKATENIQGIEQSINVLLQSSTAIATKKTVSISDRKGLLVKHNKTINGNQFELLTLIFGDEISTITLIASYPVHLAKGLSARLEKSLLSTRWLRLASQQIFQGLPFVFDQSKHLQIVKRTANSIVLIDKAPYDNTKAITPTLVVSAATSADIISDLQAFSKQQLSSARFNDEIIIKSEKPMTVNGIKAYHITAHVTDKKTGLPITFYQTIAAQKYRYLLVHGLVEQQQASQYLTQFSAIIDSLKFKKNH